MCVSTASCRALQLSNQLKKIRARMSTPTLCTVCLSCNPSNIMTRSRASVLDLQSGRELGGETGERMLWYSYLAILILIVVAVFSWQSILLLNLQDRLLRVLGES